MTDVQGAPAPDDKADKKKTPSQPCAPAPSDQPAAAVSAEPAPAVAPSEDEINARIAAAVAAALANAAAQKEREDREARDTADMARLRAVQAQNDAEAALVAASGAVKVRILKNGDGKVCTGGWDVEANAAETFKVGDTPVLPRVIAQELEDRLFVEIQ